MFRVKNNNRVLYASLDDNGRVAIDLETRRVTMGDLCEFVGLKRFDYAVPIDFYGQRGVWSYDSELGFSPVFGGFLSLERIISLATDIVVRSVNAGASFRAEGCPVSLQGEKV